MRWFNLGNSLSDSDSSEIPLKFHNYDPELVLKVLDPEYSVFENFQSRIPTTIFFHIFIVSVFSLIGFGGFLSWLIISLKIGFDKEFSTIALSLEIPLMSLVPFYFIFRKIKGYFILKRIGKLVYNKEITVLQKMFPETHFRLGESYEKRLAFFALLSFLDKRALLEFADSENAYYWINYKKTFNVLKEVLAIKLDYYSSEEFLNDYKSQKTEMKKKIKKELIAIPITKAYSIETLPEDARCMISKTKIDSSTDLVVCPYCISFAKSDLLKEWLEYKSRCPSCNRHLKIEDCPIVVVKD